MWIYTQPASVWLTRCRLAAPADSSLARAGGSSPVPPPCGPVPVGLTTANAPTACADEEFFLTNNNAYLPIHGMPAHVRLCRLIHKQTRRKERRDSNPGRPLPLLTDQRSSPSRKDVH